MMKLEIFAYVDLNRGFARGALGDIVCFPKLLFLRLPGQS